MIFQKNKQEKSRNAKQKVGEVLIRSSIKKKELTVSVDPLLHKILKGTVLFDCVALFVFVA